MNIRRALYAATPRAWAGAVLRFNALSARLHSLPNAEKAPGVHRSIPRSPFSAAAALLLLASIACSFADSLGGGGGSQTGSFMIKGSWENHLLVNTTYGHITLDQVAKFVATAQPGNTMTGNVQVTTLYTEQNVAGCPAYNSGNLTWNAVLSGTFQKNSDGSLTVTLIPTPQTGPNYYPPSTSIYACTDPRYAPRPTITVLPPDMGGTLVNGKFDVRRDVPGAAATGSHYVTGHIELVPNP